MENKLKESYRELPTTHTEFKDIRKRIGSKAKRSRLPTLIAAVILILLLCGAGWQLTSAQYGMWTRDSSRSWWSVELAAGRYGLTLPETLDSEAFQEYRSYSLSLPGESHIQSFFSPHYIPYHVSYGADRELSLVFGTTENELWRYHFEFDEAGNWTAWDSDYTVLEYRGQQLQLGTTSFYDEALDTERHTRWVTWVDAERKVVVGIRETDFKDPNRVLDCAKAVIDINAA